MINRKEINKSFIGQHDLTDCGAACLLMLVRYYGGDSSIVHLRELSGTSNCGTTLLGLCQAAHNIGFSARGVEADSIQELRSLDSPCILSVRIEEKYDHYIVCWGFCNGKYIIGDPGRGILEMSEQELCAIWNNKC